MVCTILWEVLTQEILSNKYINVNIFLKSYVLSKSSHSQFSLKIDSDYETNADDGDNKNTSLKKIN